MPRAGTTCRPAPRRHAEQGEAALAAVIERSGNVTRPQAAVAYWQPRVAASVGRAESERLDAYLKYGLRQLPNADLLADWQSNIAARLAKLGLKAAT